MPNQDLKNELKRRAAHHAKRQKGLPALSKLNAGNVPLANNIFNGSVNFSAVDTCGGMGESLVEETLPQDMFEIKGDKVILYYEDVPLTATANVRDVDDWDEWEVNTDIAYVVDKWDVIDTLNSILPDEEYPDGSDDFTEEQWDKFWDVSFETLLRKYQNKVLDEFEYDAYEFGQSNIDGEQILADERSNYEDDEYHRNRDLFDESYDDDFNMSDVARLL